MVVVGAAAGCDLPEENGTGILLTSVNGRRVWQLADDDDVLMNVYGEASDLDGSWNVPIRLVASMRQITSPGDSCDLAIEDGFAVATNSDGLTIRMRLHAASTAFHPIDVPSGVSATVDYSTLDDMAVLIAHEPWHLEDREQMIEMPPIGEVRVEEGRLTLFRGWSYMSGVDTEVTLPARTVGEGTFTLGHLAFQRMICGYWMDDIGDVTLSFDPNGSHLVAESSRFQIRFAERASGAAWVYPRLRHILFSDEIEHVTDSAGAIAARYDGVPVRLQLLDGEDPVLRVTVTALHGVGASPELLTELNAMNTTRVLHRVWADNNMVVVGTDLRASDIDGLLPMLKVLTREARNLGGVLGPLFGGHAPRA